jgi:hypothetical protein
MLWTVRHEGQAEPLQLLKHWGTLVIRNNNGTFLFTAKVSPRETGFPCLLMASDYYPSFVSQGIFPAVDQTWYADDAGAGGVQASVCKAPRNRTTLRLLPRAHEEYSTVSHANLPAATAAFKDCEFTTPRQPLSCGFARRILVIVGFRKKSHTGRKGSRRFCVHGRSHPQAAHTGLQSLQCEWRFVQRVVEGIGVVSPKFSNY